MLPVEPLEKGTSLWKDALRRLAKNKLALAGFAFLCLMLAVALLTPLIAPYAYDAQDLKLGAKAPSHAHWLGTDPLGRDLLTRILYGGRISLMVGFAATAVSLLVGVLYGAMAGYAGGRADNIAAKHGTRMQHWRSKKGCWRVGACFASI